MVGNYVIKALIGSCRNVSFIIPRKISIFIKYLLDFEKTSLALNWYTFIYLFSISEIEAKYEKKMRTLREELELRRKTEIHEIEERKNSQINTLMKNHEKAFSDIKNYYNDITLNNLALINSLKVMTLFPSINILFLIHSIIGFLKSFFLRLYCQFYVKRHLFLT